MLSILFPKPKFKVSLSPSWVKKDPWKKVKPLSVSIKGFKVKIPISGLLFSIDLIVKSVFSKFSFKKLSNELTNLFLIFKVSANEKGVNKSKKRSLKKS